MTRGIIYASEFQRGSVVTLADRNAAVEVLRETGRYVFNTASRGAIESFTAKPSDPDLRVAAPQTGTLSTPWRYARWAVVDTETTGTDDDARIVEIAVVHMRFGLIESVWSSLVNPGIPIPEEAIGVHGITDAMVASAPSIESLIPEIERRIEAAAVCVGYNIYGYDEPKMKANGISIRVPIIDALPMVQEHGRSQISDLPARLWKSLSERHETRNDDEDDDFDATRINWRRVGRHSLARAAYEMREDDPEPGIGATLHRATWDAVLTGRLLWHMRQWGQRPATEMEPLLRDILARQQASMAAFIAKKRASRVVRTADERIREALHEIREAMREQASFLEWMKGAKTP